MRNSQVVELRGGPAELDSLLEEWEEAVVLLWDPTLAMPPSYDRNHDMLVMVRDLDMQFPNGLLIVTVNIMEHPEIGGALVCHDFPTTLFFRENVNVGRVVGRIEKRVLHGKIEACLDL